jgi:hypothetical protein
MIDENETRLCLVAVCKNLLRLIQRDSHVLGTVNNQKRYREALCRLQYVKAGPTVFKIVEERNNNPQFFGCLVRTQRKEAIPHPLHSGVRPPILEHTEAVTHHNDRPPPPEPIVVAEVNADPFAVVIQDDVRTRTDHGLKSY